MRRRLKMRKRSLDEADLLDTDFEDRFSDEFEIENDEDLELTNVNMCCQEPNCDHV